MKIAVAAESDPGEPRVAATPETVKKMTGLGAEVAVEPRAGVKSGILDTDYTAAGATVAADAMNGADIVLRVRRPSAAELGKYKRGALVIAINKWDNMTDYARAEVKRQIDLKLDIGTESEPVTLWARITQRACQELQLAPGKPVFALVKTVALDHHSYGRYDSGEAETA